MKRLLIISIVWMWAHLAFACPCGCGSINQLSLQPGESLRWQFALNHDRLGEVYGFDGKVGQDGGPTSSTTLQLSLAYGLLDNVSLSLGLPFEYNRHGNFASDGSVADPSLGLLFVAHRVRFDRPWVPQIAFGVNYKHPVGRNKEDGAQKDYEVDIHSNGWQEVLASSQITWEWPFFSFDLNQALIHRPSQKVELGDRQAKKSTPWGSRSVATLGYTVYGEGTFTASLGREYFSPLKIDGTQVARSEVVKRYVTLALQLRVGHKKTLGFSYTKNGAYGTSVNTPASDTFSTQYGMAI